MHRVTVLNCLVCVCVSVSLSVTTPVPTSLVSTVKSTYGFILGSSRFQFVVNPSIQKLWCEKSNMQI